MTGPAHWTAEQRFWTKVDKTGPCWEWTGYRRPDGYGQVRVDGVLLAAHRYSWSLRYGPVPDGLTLDHLCRNPACVRPSHLEPVTRGENVRRGIVGLLNRARITSTSECQRGHPFDAENTYVKPNGVRACRTCKRESLRQWRARQKGVA